MPSSVRVIAYALATFVTIIAVASLSARIVLANLDLFEDWVNESAEQYLVEVTGLSGDFVYFNPVVKADAVQFAYGTMRELYFELDTFESLLRNRIVVRRFVVAEASATIRDAIDMLDQESDLPDWLDVNFFADADQLHLEDVRILFATEHATQRFHLTAHSGDLDGRHEIRFTINSPDCTPCSIKWSWETVEVGAGPFIEDRNGELSVSNFLVDPAALGVNWIRPLVIDGYGSTHQDGSELKAHGTFEVHNVVDDENRFGGQLLLSEFDGFNTVELREIWVSNGDEEITLEPMFVREFDGETAVWSERVDLESIVTLVSGLLAPESGAYAWVEALAPKGVALNPHISVYEDAAAIRGELIDAEISAYEDVPAFEATSILFDGPLLSPRLQTNGIDATLGYQRHFDSSWELSHVASDLQMSFASNRLALRAIDSSGELEGMGGSVFFLLNRDLFDTDVSFSLLVDVDDVELSMANAMQFVPRAVRQDAIGEWLEANVHEATFTSTLFSHHVYETEDTQLDINLQNLQVDFRDVVSTFLDGWPTIRRATGQLSMNPTYATVVVDSGAVLESDVSALVTLPMTGDDFQVALQSTETPGQFVQFVLSTQLREELPFVKASWLGGGSLTVNAELDLTYSGAPLEKGDIQGNFRFADATIEDTDLELTISELNGSVDYVSPYDLSGSNLTGVLFGRSLTADVKTVDDVNPPVVQVGVAGSVDPDSIFDWIELPAHSYFDGITEYSGVFSFSLDEITPPKLEVHTDNVGTVINVADPLDKLAEEIRPANFTITLEDEATLLTIESEQINSWMRWVDGEIEEGVLGILADISAVEPREGKLLMVGRLDRFEMDFGSGLVIPHTLIEIDSFRIDEVELFSEVIDRAVIQGSIGAGKLDIQLESEQIKGSFSRSYPDPYDVYLSEIIWPSQGEDAPDDPLSVEDAAVIPDMHLRVDQVFVVGEGVTEDYGSHEMDIVASDDRITFENMVSDIRGLHIESRGDCFWDTTTDRTHCDAIVAGSDIGEALKAWDYEAPIQSREFNAAGDLLWQGSPLAISPATVSGKLDSEVIKGKFDSASAGAGLRLLGLFNFSRLLNRMQLDFGDVLGSGFAYEEISIDATLDEGLVIIENPLKIKARSAEFRIQGLVDINKDDVNLEIIATLPLSKSLPWYSVAVGVSNPLAGLGMLIGSQVVEQPIRQLTSGKYTATGSIYDPEVEFIRVFETELSGDSLLKDYETRIPGLGTALP